ncbi:MAG: hypothetical protein HZC55_24940 [Verrucomicrobia bacterium]|nr:hypothetical protein [Verrucomicrobiota bacterium]
MNASTACFGPDRGLPRRDFLRLSASAAGTLGSLALTPPAIGAAPRAPESGSARGRGYLTGYAGAGLNRIAFPLGGIGAGMVCLEGTGAVSHVSVRHQPDVFHEPCTFAAVAIRGSAPIARVLEGPVPPWKLFGTRGTARGAAGSSFGLPRFARARFAARFPFGTVNLEDEAVPVRVELTGWSPFIPGDADNSSLPVAALEYRFSNPGAASLEAVFSYHARNFLAPARSTRHGVQPLPEGFCLWGAGSADKPWEEGWLAATAGDPAVKVNHAWFRGGWWDPLTMAWKDVESGACVERPPITEGAPAPGASLFVPFTLGPGESRTVVVRLAWYVPRTNLRAGHDLAGMPEAERSALPTYRPWYAGKFPGIAEVSAAWTRDYAELRRRSEEFSRCFHDSTLPPEVIEAVAANLTILKSPTMLRETDGRLWAWEGCNDDSGCCFGSCTHVWNYAQAVAHLFPALERTLRETEFGPAQDEQGHQNFRVALPIRPERRRFHAAADGQLGGIMKVHRDWRISGDTAWLRTLWPRVRRSLDYCIGAWDPERKGWLEEPHHNTYDIEFWGPDGMCTSIYLGALRAAVAMGRTLGDDVTGYEELAGRAARRLATELFDGEYFIQKIQWKGLRATDPEAAQAMQAGYSPEARALLEREGPKYQYGTGCLADGVLGEWLAQVCGVGPVLDPGQVRSHLRAVHRHNLKHDLSTHANPQRPSYAAGGEGGLLLCTWPKGGALSLPFVYSNEVWTGIEYQVASHLILMGEVEAGREIVRTCRDRYAGDIRNPFNEYECGHWYARALASYALLQALGGAWYDAVERVLHLAPAISGDFRCFLATATGYGTVGVREGRPFCEVRSGTIEVRRIDFRPAR